MARFIIPWSVVAILLQTVAPAVAQSPFDTCEIRLETEPDSQEAARCFEVAALDHGQLEEASRRLKKHTEEIEEPASSWLHFYLGNILWRFQTCGGLPENHYRRAAELFSAQGLRKGEHLAWVNYARVLARCSRNLNEIEDELTMVDRAAEASGDLLTLLMVQDTRLRLRRREGGDLETTYNEAKKLWQLAKNPALDKEDGIVSMRREYLSTLGDLCNDLGKFGEAQEWNLQRRMRSQEAGDLRDVVAVRFNMIESKMALELPTADRRARYLQELRDVLLETEAVENIRFEAETRWRIAKMEGGPDAETHFDRCLEIALELGDQRLRRRCTLAQANHWLSTDPDQARALLSRLYGEGLFASRDRRALIDGRDDHLRVLWQTSAREDALIGAERILADIEGLRRPQTGMARARILDVWSDTYYWLSGRLLLDTSEEADPEVRQAGRRRAFSFMERLRVQELRESLLLAGDASPWLPPPPPNLLDQVVLGLDEGEAMLSFQFSLWQDFYGRFAGGAWVLASTKAGTRVHQLKLDRLLVEPLVKTLDAQSEGSWNVPTLTALHQALLQTALDELPKDTTKLVINPDGILHLLPFAALRATEDAPTLAEQYEISIVPSAALWLEWKKSNAPQKRAAGLVLAAPDLPGSQDLPLAALRGDDLGPLPFARREGRKVARHLRGPIPLFGDSRLLRGAEASEQFLKQTNLEPFGLLHFATHAVVDRESPWLSGVLLAGDDDSEDGWLRPEEIAKLDLAGTAVILSTCNSATGGWLRGEGVMSLARAFFEAGAHAVVGTLRPLPDDLGEQFFDEFYSHLVKGSSLRQALAYTQRRWARAGRPTSAWASVVVLGNGDLTPLPEGARPWYGSPRTGLALVLLGLVLLASVLALRARNRKP